MKIIHLITILEDGGAEAVLYRLCANDRQNRHIVISMQGRGKYGPMLEAAGIEVHCLNMPAGHLTWSGVSRLFTLLRRERPDLLQTWMYHADLVGGIIGRLAGVKRIYWNIRHSDLAPADAKRATILVAKLCARLSGPIPQRIICCASKAQRVHTALGYRAAKFTIIGNGYDLSIFRRDPTQREALREALGLAQDALVLGMVGRFNEQKDHATLIKSLQRLREQGVDFTCLLVGKQMTADNPTLAAWVDENGLRDHIRLLGQRTDISAVMNALDIHLLSSSSGEAFPNVLAEAMACGTPCVTTDVGDAAEIVADVGRVVPPRQPEAIAAALHELIEECRSHPQRWQQRQAAAVARITGDFSLAAMIANYDRVWHEGSRDAEDTTASTSFLQ
ncbi:glycosyltransferase family 4 protein [Halomonas marinisediminis]|uniref:Glycosyltransferase n=1 Tax=Halomonas marinisediminis TaxID=2546095 RepID=A0ABY2D3C0_9GAMM|nr:glycosyltransferase [Halomonas marinisediminis]TDA95748.1 glycosyltransferase [Halomonas marinisediminis]